MKPSHTPPPKVYPYSRAELWCGIAVAVLWFLVTTGMTSRVHLVMGYTTIPAGPPQLELFLASGISWLAVGCLTSLWIWLWVRWLSVSQEKEPNGRTGGFAGSAIGILGALALAMLPSLSLSLLRSLDNTPPIMLGGPAYWEPLWLSLWSGTSFANLLVRVQLAGRVEIPLLRPTTGLAGASLLAAAWWHWQTASSYADYMLGFNDFGHFAQRVANTAAGRGFLLESPVLPPFWDHFNPGLLLLVPLWKLFPSVQLLFALQACALAGSALIVSAIARRFKLDSITAALFGLAWLVQPALGQMNLAYTYGWHPITLAIPALLIALWALLGERRLLALSCALLAMSMEEGVIVVVTLFCAACACYSYNRPRMFGLSSWQWLLAATAHALGFVLVYRFSGLAEFQTGRFVALGDNLWQVVLSPLLRPQAFWGSLFRWEKLAFLLSLCLPCYLPSLLRGWRWLLPTLLPLLVLMVWDHRPASSLAFQYASTLLPLLWLATISGAKRPVPAVGTHSPLEKNAESTTETTRGRLPAVGALATGLILSLFVGQLPYSSPTLLDVTGMTYGEQFEQRRRADEPDGLWLTEQLINVAADGGPVLATGRIAAHLVGNRDVETVGQYLLRKPQLSQLPDRRDFPIRFYHWIILDHREGFQQTAAEIATVRAEAMAAGFILLDEQYDIVVLQRQSSTTLPSRSPE